MKFFGYEISVQRPSRENNRLAPITLEDLCQVVSILQTQVNKIDKKVYRGELKEAAEGNGDNTPEQPAVPSLFPGMATTGIED